MANVYLKDSTLTSIGDAIRSKNGTTTKYKPSEMPAAITAISGGGTPVAKKRFKIENPITLSPGVAAQTGPIWGAEGSPSTYNGFMVTTPAVHRGDAFVGIWFAPDNHESDMAIVVDTIDDSYSIMQRDSRRPNDYPDQFTYYKATEGHPNENRYLRACFSTNLDYFAEHSNQAATEFDIYDHGFFLALSYTSSNGSAGKVQGIPLLVRGGATALSAPKQVLLGPAYSTTPVSYTTTQENEIVCVVLNKLRVADTRYNTARDIYTDKLDTNIWYNGNSYNRTKRFGVVYAPTAGTTVTFVDQVPLNGASVTPVPNDVQFISMTLS